MGIETKPTSFRLPDEALRQLDELQHAFAPAAKNRADCLTLLVALAHSAVIVRGKIATAIERMQSLLRSEFVAQTEIDFDSPTAFPNVVGPKPLVRVPSKARHTQDSHGRGRFSRSVSQRRAVGAEVLWAHASSPFPAGVRRTFAYQFNTARVA